MINKETYKRLTANGERININTNLQLAQVYNRLAELEDKIENGTLIELPCKVGDTLYIIFKRQWSVANGTTYWNIQKTKLTYGNMDRVIKEYGEFVFLTREKAEKRLKELKND